MSATADLLEGRAASDPSSGWTVDAGIPLDFDLVELTLAGVRIGDAADGLSFLGPGEDPVLAAEGRLYYFSSGLEVQVEDGKIVLYRFIWRDELGEGFNPFPGRITHAPSGMEIGRDSSELAMRRACGAPYFRSRDSEGVCVFFENEVAGWDAEFTAKGDIKQLTIYTPPLTEDEKKLLDPETEDEVEPPPPPEPDRTFRQELWQCLIWPFLPFMVVVAALVLSFATQGLRSVYRLTRHGVSTQAVVLRGEEALLQGGRRSKGLIYSYADEQGRQTVHRLEERAARWLAVGPGERFPVTYDRRNPPFHVRYVVNRGSLLVAVRNTVLLFVIVLTPALLATVGAAAFIVWRRRNPPAEKPAPKKTPDYMPFGIGPPPRKRRRDGFRLILQGYGLLCLLIIAQLAWTGMNESRAYERLWQRGAPAKAPIVRAVLTGATPGAEEYTITYAYADIQGRQHVASTQCRRSESRWVIAYSQISHPPFARRWTEWLPGPEPKVGKEVIVSYFQDEPEVHLPFLLSDDVIARPIMGAVRMSFTTLSGLTCFVGCFLGLGYLVLLRR